MTRNELKQRYPRASESFIKANSDPDCAGAVAVLERNTQHESLAPNQIQAPTAGRLHIRFVSVRKRLCDPDNLSEKWLLDALRFTGAIQGDEPDKITLETTQRKCGKNETEHTLVEIYQ